MLQRIDHWIGSSKKGTGILGIGDTIVRAMWDEQLIQDAADLYTLTVDDLKDLQLNGGGVVGESRARKIVAAIAGKRNLSLHIFLGSLGIELLGRRRVQILAKAANGELDKLSDWMDDQKLADIQIEGFGDAIRDAVRDGVDDNRNMIAKLLQNGVTVDEPDTQAATPSGGMFAGVTFCLTGTRECQDDIVELGGELTSSVAKSKPRPDFLVQKDPLSTSNKTKNAEANGHTRIIALDFLKKVIAGNASLDSVAATPDEAVSVAQTKIANDEEFNKAVEAEEGVDTDALAAELAD
jgi:DNA ligase (NAD+)